MKKVNQKKGVKNEGKKQKNPKISEEDKKRNRIGWTILIIFGVLKF